MSGADIAAEIEAALMEAGEAVGDGPLYCTLRKQGTKPTSPHDTTPVGQPKDFQLVGIAKTKRIRDASGSLIGQTVRMLTVNATGVSPSKNDEIAVEVALADVTENTVFEVISEVHVTAPGGTPIKYQLELSG